MNKIIKTLAVEDIDIREINEKTRTIWHRISKEVKDRMGDIVRIDGLDTANFRKKPAVLYGHNYAGLDPIPVIGRNVGFEKDGKALYAGTRFLNTAEVSSKLADLVGDLWYLNKQKLMGWSIGFLPLGPPDDLKENGRTVGKDYKRSELLEYSNVIIPANQEAVNDAISRGVVTRAVKDFFQSAPELDVEKQEKWGIKIDPEIRQKLWVLREKGLKNALEMEWILHRFTTDFPEEKRVKFYYKPVDEAAVPEKILTAAYRVLDYCQRKLRLADLEIRWLCKGQKNDDRVATFNYPIYGTIEGHKIKVREDLPVSEIMKSIAHEAHHIWFAENLAGKYPYDKEEAMWESAANAFAEIVTLELLERDRREPLLSTYIPPR
jgi:hypothetical protein